MDWRRTMPPEEWAIRMGRLRRMLPFVGAGLFGLGLYLGRGFAEAALHACIIMSIGFAISLAYGNFGQKADGPMGWLNTILRLVSRS